MDSLGGILTGGLLGNPILGYYNLSIFNIIEIRIEEYTGGHSHAGYYPDDKLYDSVYLKINLFNREYKETFIIPKTRINIFIKFVSFIKNVKDKIINIKLRKSKIENIKVKFNEKN